MTVLGLAQQTTEPEVQQHSDTLEWHQDCLAVTVLLASALSEKEMKRLLKRAGQPVEARRKEQILGDLHESCHHNRELRIAVNKEIGRKFNNTVMKMAGRDVEGILEAADKRTWLPPLIWACYQHDSPEVRALGRRLAHLVMLLGMQGLRAGQQQPEDAKKRQARLAAKNRDLSSRITDLNDENQKLKAQLRRKDGPKESPPSQEQPSGNASKKEIKKLNKQIHQLEQELRKQRQELSVWRGLALSERDGELKPARKPEKTNGRERERAHTVEEVAMAGQVCTNTKDCPLRGRKVAVIGGLDRLKPNYCKAIADMGGECLFHTGETRSGVKALRNVVAKSDLVIYITTINSHGAMKVVKKQCKRCQTPFCPMQGSGVKALENLLRAIEKQGGVFQNQA